MFFARSAPSTSTVEKIGSADRTTLLARSRPATSATVAAAPCGVLTRCTCHEAAVAVSAKRVRSCGRLATFFARTVRTFSS